MRLNGFLLATHLATETENLLIYKTIDHLPTIASAYIFKWKSKRIFNNKAHFSVSVYLLSVIASYFPPQNVLANIKMYYELLLEKDYPTTGY